MKLLPTAAAIALITATAAYAQSGNTAPTNLSPSNQSQDIQNNAAPAAPSSTRISKPGAKAHSIAHSRTAAQMSRARQDAAERPVTEELNRQQLELANRPDAGGAPQTATRPGDCMGQPCLPNGSSSY